MKMVKRFVTVWCECGWHKLLIVTYDKSLQEIPEAAKNKLFSHIHSVHPNISPFVDGMMAGVTLEGNGTKN